MTPKTDGPIAHAAPGDGPLRHVPCGGGLTMALRDIGGVLVIGLYGPVGPSAQRGLHAALHSVFTSDPPRIVIDASCVTECDGSGLGAFIDASERAADSGIPFALSGLARRHRQLLQILWRPDVTTALSHVHLDQAVSDVRCRMSLSDRTREELLEDVDELHQALIDIRIVEQATGILMAVYGFTADAATALLHSHARAQSEKVPELAGRLVGSLQRADTGASPSTYLDALLDGFATEGSLDAGALHSLVT